MRQLYSVFEEELVPAGTEPTAGGNELKPTGNVKNCNTSQKVSDTKCFHYKI